MTALSSNEAIAGICAPDDNVEVRGYVDKIIGPEIVGTQKPLNLLKFSLNNGADKRIQCLAWEAEAKRVAKIIAMGKILHIEGAKAKSVLNPRFNIGNVSFELTITKITEITDGGIRQNFIPARRVGWEEVAEMIDDLEIVIEGYIKFNFRETRHPDNGSSYGMGSITDGHKKLEIRLTSPSNLPPGLQKGTHIEVTGKVQNGNYLYLKVESGRSITLTGREPMDPEAMINTTESPMRRQRLPYQTTATRK